MSTKVKFGGPKGTNLSLFEETDQSAPIKAKVVSIDNSPQFSSESSEPLSIDDLYPEPTVIGSELGPALRLLAEGKTAIEESMGALKRGEIMAADDHLQRLQVMLPELFCCRALGDGFGAIVNALKFSFLNAEGAPFTGEQIEAVAGAVQGLRAEPFLRFDRAVSVITRLEDAGLRVDPPTLVALTDLMDDDQELR